MVFGKIFQNLVSPLPIALFLILVAWVLRKKRERFARNLFSFTFIALLLFSNRLVSYWLISRIENAYPAQNLFSLEPADAIIVLGGSLSGNYEPLIRLEENSGSRLVPAINLFRMKKAPTILVSGGNPYRRFDGVERREADDMATFLEELGIPAEAIIKEGLSRNTEENAIEVIKILRERKFNRVLLVTSAFHMKRAVYLFEKYGQKVVPIPGAYKSGMELRYWYIFLIPNANALELSALALKEHLGLLWAAVKPQSGT